MRGYLGCHYAQNGFLEPLDVGLYGPPFSYLHSRHCVDGVAKFCDNLRQQLFPVGSSKYVQRLVSFIFGDSRSCHVDINIRHHKDHELYLVEEISKEHYNCLLNSHINHNRRNIEKKHQVL